jgi:molybdenum cofactor cytidylyltransferase
VPDSFDGVVVLLGDMPRVTAGHIDGLIAAFGSDARVPIVVPLHEGRHGNPVLWPADLFPKLLQLEGDSGAKRLIAAHPARVVEVDLGTDAIFADVDTPEALAQMRGS